jgi:3-oxoacyl-[acyl-carrier-protein] synthase III
LIASGVAKRVLLITAETYTKYIDQTDRSLRTIFGDGAAATLIQAVEQPSLGNFVFGTDGEHANLLVLDDGGARPKEDAIQPNKHKRWPSRLYMAGPELVNFTMEIAPPLIDRVLGRAGWARADVDTYLLHQATSMMLKNLRAKLELNMDNAPEMMENYGNTVSSTIPLLIHDLRATGRLHVGQKSMLLGFGVGLSWAGCTWIESWQAPDGMKLQTAHEECSG